MQLGYDQILFCGYHLFSCVHNNYFKFIATSKRRDSTAIIHNLSIVKPGRIAHNIRCNYVYYTYNVGFMPMRVIYG